MKKFKLQMLGSLGALILLIITAVVSVNLYYFQEESIGLHKRILKEKNDAVAELLEERFNGQFTTMNGITIADHDVGEGLSNAAVEQLEMVSRTYGDSLEGAYIIDRSGGIYNHQGIKLEFNVRQLGRDYYSALFQDHKDTFISDPIISKVTNKNIIVLAKKLTNEIGIIASVYSDKLLSDLGEGDNLFLYNRDGLVLLDSNNKLKMGQNIYDGRPFYKEFAEGNEYLTYEVDKGSQTDVYTAYYRQFENTEWRLVTYTLDDEIREGVNSQIRNSMLVAFISIIVSSISLLYILNRLVLTPVGGAPDEIAKEMAWIAEGDLTKLGTATGNETGIHASLYSLVSNLREVISDSHDISNTVSAASSQLNNVMSNSMRATDSSRVEIDQIATAITELSSTSSEVSQNASQAESETKGAVENIEAGRLTLEESIAVANKVQDATSRTNDIIHELNQSSIEINSVIEVIDNISEQTNLLALNAAIEAARAGEAGRGFAVVADEVRSLASKTQESTVDIQKIITRLQEQSGIAQDIMNENVGLINKSTELTDGVKAAFEDIQVAVMQISSINAIVATASHEQSSVTEDIAKNAAKTLELIRDNVDAAEESIEAASNLAYQAELQKTQLNKFTV